MFISPLKTQGLQALLYISILTGFRPTECSYRRVPKQQETHAAALYMVGDSSPGKEKSLGGFSHPRSNTLWCQVQSSSHYQLPWAGEEEDD